MLTYQDLQKVSERDDDRIAFCRRLMREHKNSPLYQTAVIAKQYDKHQNATITQYQKLLYTVTGRAVPDNYGANFKMASRFFNRFVVQETQYLLGNGVSWRDPSTGQKLGEDFDYQLQKAAHSALVGGVAFGFFNLDHMDVFDVTEFAPLYDETNGALMAGVRFWQIAHDKPLRMTLYEVDGYTDYMIKSGKGEVVHQKRPYILRYTYTPADGAMIYDGLNYPSFPIVPLWGNPYRQSEIVGLREQIDCYDLIKSGFANTVDEASLIFWTIKNAGGMDDVDLAQFLQRVRTVHAAAVDEESEATPHQLEAPYQSRQALLERLREDLYDDAMALDTKRIASGAATATEIKAAYEPLNNKTDQFEYCVLDFLQEVLRIAGIDDEPTFTRSLIVNTGEEVQMVLAAAAFLDGEYVTRKIMTLLGDADQIEDALTRINADDYEKFTGGVNGAESGIPADNGAETV